MDTRRFAVIAGALLLVLGLTPLSTARAGEGTAPNVLRATLSNGLRVVIVRNRLAPVVTTQISYLVGSDETPQGFPGTAHALEHMMFRGSPGMTRAQLATIGAGMGGDFNAFTTQGVTSYYFAAPAQDLSVALHIGATRMRGLDLTEHGWNKERGAIEQEVSHDLSSPFYVFQTRLLAQMFKGTPYAHDALGSRPSFNATQASLLRNFYEKWYAPNNAILVVAGDIQPAATLVQIKTLFGSIPSKKLPARPHYDFRPVKAETLHYPTDYPVGVDVISYRMPGLKSSDYAAASILSQVLSSQRGALFALVPEGKALFASFQTQFMPHAGVGYAIGAFPKGGDSAALLKQMRGVLASLAQRGVPADLVAAAKRKSIARLEFQKNSITGLANAWTSAIAFQGHQSPEQMAAAYRGVTVEQVNRLAHEILQPDHAITAILTPESSGKAVAGKGFGGAESFSEIPEKPVQLPVWARHALSKVSVPTSTVHPLVKILPNGLRLIVQPESISNTVTVIGSVRNNPALQQPRGEEGAAGVLQGLFSYGTTTLNRLAFHKALDDLAASESGGYQFSLTVPAEHFQAALALLAANERHPALPKHAFMITRMQTARSLVGQLQTPAYRFQRAIDKALLPVGDPGLREATPKKVRSLSYQQIRNYYTQTFRPDLTTIVVIGKVTPTKAEQAISQAFGNWKNKGSKPQLTLPSVPLNSHSFSVVPDKTSLQDSVTFVQNVPVTLYSPERYALKVGNQVLGQGGFASRLWRDLRVKTGLVYGVSSDFSLGRTRSTYSVTLGSDPGKVSQARAIVYRDVRSMQNKPITALELKRAQGMLVRRIPLFESSVNAIANDLLYYAQHKLPLNQPTIAAHNYLKVTPAAIQAAFRKTLRVGHFVEVVKGPAPK